MKNLITVIFAAALLLTLFPKRLLAVDFVISDPQVNQNFIDVVVNLSAVTNASCPNQVCYLQALIKSVSEDRYFGFTKNNSEQWIEYVSNPEPSYIQNNFFKIPIADGAWSGRLSVKFDQSNQYYVGPGDYTFKVKRYTGDSNYGSESNSINIVLSLPTSSPTPSPSNSPTSTPMSTPTATSTPVPTKSPTPKPTIKPTAKPSPSSIPEVLGEETSEPTSSPIPTEMPSESKNKFPYLAFGMIGLGISSIGAAFFPFLKAKFKEYNGKSDENT